MSVLVETGHHTTYPLNHARIMWQNVITGATATGAQNNYPAAAALTKTTYERWSPAVSGDSITLTFPEQYINCIALAAHSNLNPTVEVRVAGAWQTVTAYPPGGESLELSFSEDMYGVLEYSPDNEAIMFLMQKRMADAVRITVTYSGTAPTLGVVMAGTVLEMHRPLYAGHNPALLSSDSKVQPNVSESGEWLGASLLRQGRNVNISWNNLPASWVRKYWQPFAQGLKTNPFVVAWNPLKASPDAIYCSSSNQPQPNNSGTRNLQSVSLTARGYSDGTDPVVRTIVDKDFADLITFTRASEATYYDAQGVLQTAAVDEPRLTYDPETGESLGLLIEEQRTRLNTIAEAPTVAEDVTVSEVAHTISFFGTGTVDLSGAFADSLVGTGANDRVTLTFTPTAGTLTLTPSGTVENLQLEAGSFATSVILGEGSQVTRSADNASVDDLSGWFNALSHTIYGVFNPDYFPSDQVAIFGFGSVQSNRVSASIDNGALRIIARKEGGSITGGTFSDLQLLLGADNRIAFSFDGSTLTVAVNGASDTASVNTYPNTLDVLTLGQFSHTSGFRYTGKIVDFRAIPRALSVEELQILTAPEAN